MLTEEQKNCRYCNFEIKDGYGHSFNFADDNGWFTLERYPRGYFLRADDEDVVVDSEYINYCPMCGRKLGKEE